MTTFYRSPDVLVTDQVFVLRRPYPIRFRITLLHAAYIICSEPRYWWRPASVERELRAIYGLREVCLYRSHDPIAFGQVRRALQRALENCQQRLEQAA